MNTKKDIEVSGHPTIEEYTLTSKSGAFIKVLNLGGIISNISIPDKSGLVENVCLGLDDPKDYLKDHPCLGALVGRYANRIAKGFFGLNGKEYQLPINNGENTLHGGPDGFDKKFWNVEIESDVLKLKYKSENGEMGFPGNFIVEVLYQFTEEHVLKINYKAECDQSTPVNLTHHGYFNLEGAGKSTVGEHVFQMYSDRYTPVNEAIIPTGEILTTKDTQFDFSKKTTLQDRFDQGYEFDHNLILRENDENLKLAVDVLEPNSGRTMKMYTTEPAFQFYTANFLDGSLGNSKGSFEKWGGFCLEAQHYPDSVNHSNFPSCILNPGEIYTQSTEYHFGC